MENGDRSSIPQNLHEALARIWSAHESGVRDAQAIQWFLTAAESGDCDAQCQLGNMHAMGRDVAQDDCLAAEWYKKAAEAGHVGAQTTLGNLYALGRGVPQDYLEAVRWLCKAITQGDPTAMYSLGGMYEKGLGVSQDFVQALRYYWLSSYTSIFGKEFYDRLAAKMTPSQIAKAKQLSNFPPI